MITQQFQGVTPARWIDIKQVMHSDAHIDIQNDEGSSEAHGINFSWLLASAVLTVTIDVPHFSWLLKAAGFHTEQDVMTKFAAWIDGVS